MRPPPPTPPMKAWMQAFNFRRSGREKQGRARYSSVCCIRRGGRNGSREHPNSPRVDSTPLPRGKLSPALARSQRSSLSGALLTDSEQCGGRQPCAVGDAQENRPEGRAARVESHAHSRVHAVLNCCVSRWSPRRNQRWDMAERDRLQGRSGRRIRAPKQSGAVSFILFRVRAKVQLVQFRAAMTGLPSDERRSERRRSRPRTTG
jgi:hypothetical protein